MVLEQNSANVKGYVDDCTVVGSARDDLEWTINVRQLFGALHTAGFEITEHNCWKAIYAPPQEAHNPPVGCLQQLSPQAVLELEQTTGHCTCIEAIKPLVPQRHQEFVSRCSHYYRLPAKEFGALIQDSILTYDNRTVFSLAAEKCNCKAKTALVCNFEPQPAHILTLEESTFGLASLTAETVQLGLVVHGPLQLTTDLQKVPEEGPRTFF